MGHGNHGAYVNWALGSIGDIGSGAQPVLDLFGLVPMVGLRADLFGVAGWLYLNGRKGEQASVAAVQEGARR